MSALFLAVATCLLPAAGADPPSVTLGRPAQFVYGSFQDHVAAEGGATAVRADSGRGGMGANLPEPADWSAFADFSPVLHLRRLPGNQARLVQVLLRDRDGKAVVFGYDLVALTDDKVAALLPNQGLPLAHEVAKAEESGFDPAAVTQWQVLGDYQPAALHVAVEKIAFAAPTPALERERGRYAAELAESRRRDMAQAERERQARQRLLDGATHPPDGAVVVEVLPVGDRLLAVVLQDRAPTTVGQRPYAPQPGDHVESEGPTALVHDGAAIVPGSHDRHLRRRIDGRDRRVGHLAGQDVAVWPGDAVVGTPLATETIDVPRAYRVRRLGEIGVGAAMIPTAVHRKSVPVGPASDRAALRHAVFLELPEALHAGAEYEIDFVGLNTRAPSRIYTHDPRSTRSPAVHASQVGYRPGDPLKRATLSLWLGTGGGRSFGADRFELIDAASGRTVHTGKVELALAADQPGTLPGGRNHNLTDVCRMDFGDFAAPGRYRVFVPGVGCSEDFPVADDVWTDAYRVSMSGFLHHRSGIALGPPTTDTLRPRPMHPADGVKVYQLDVTVWDGEAAAVDAALRRLTKTADGYDDAELTVDADAWGGSMDAGDWDRRSPHLDATYLLLELAELAPGFAATPLRLPPAEAANAIPDLLDEALWNLTFFARLQQADGGVRGGVESTDHPRVGEASWQETLLLGVFAADPETTARFAACAAKASRLLAPHDRAMSQRYAAAAVKAWDWLEDRSEAVIAQHAAQGHDVGEIRKRVASRTTLAAIELLHATGAAGFRAHVEGEGRLPLDQWVAADGAAVLFAYCLLPADRSEAGLRRRARDTLAAAAERALAFQAGNAFGVAASIPQVPMIGYTCTFSVPEGILGPTLPRMHHLTGDARYLRGAILSTQYAVGANPLNRTLTTGLGRVHPQHPLHIDSRVSGQAPPTGITVYGPHDPTLSNGSVDWAHQWHLREMVPPGRTWPTTEFYVDIPDWPVMTEYTIHQTFGPTAYTFGYLAATGR